MDQLPREVEYRLRLADGFLNESREDRRLERWRSCVDNSQLAVENAAKAALALIAPVGRTHNPSILLRTALDRSEFSPEVREDVTRLAEVAELLGPDVHSQSDYGDEAAGKTPWELFDKSAADQALALAEEAVRLTAVVVAEG